MSHTSRQHRGRRRAEGDSHAPDIRSEAGECQARHTLEDASDRVDRRKTQTHSKHEGKQTVKGPYNIRSIHESMLEGHE